MAKQAIGTGSSPNDGNGDTIRDAFIKVNSNQDELYEGANITATSPIAKTSSADTSVTLSLADDSITEVKLDCTNTPTDNYYLTFDNASGGFTWVAGTSGDITGVTAGTGLSGGGAGPGDVTLNIDISEFSDVTPANGDKLLTLDSDGAAEQLTTVASLATLFAGDGLTASSSVMAVNVDDSTIETNSDAIRLKDLGVATGKIANDAVTNAKLGVEYTATSAVSSGSSIAVDTALADIFTYTAGHSATLNFTNVVIGAMKSLVITGGGSSYTVALGTSNGSSCTFNKISGTYDDTGSTKNLIQIKWVAVNEAWYTISQPA